MSLAVWVFASGVNPLVASSLKRLSEVACEFVLVVPAAAAPNDWSPIQGLEVRVSPGNDGDADFLLDLHRACSSDWVLKLGGDEIVSARLVEELPELLGSRPSNQFSIPRRWLYPDPNSWISSDPWWPDQRVSLVRNLPSSRFQEDDMTAALLSPSSVGSIYRFDLLTLELSQRWKLAVRHEVTHPGRLSNSGLPWSSRFLPEKFDPKEYRITPAEDLMSFMGVAPALKAAAEKGAQPVVAQSPFSEIKDQPIQVRTSTNRPVVVYPVHSEIPENVSSGQQLSINVEISNRGETSVSSSSDVSPAFQLGAIWRPIGEDSAVISGALDSISHLIEPRSTSRQFMNITIPEKPGPYELEFGLWVGGADWLGSGNPSRHKVVELPRSLGHWIEETPGAMVPRAPGQTGANQAGIRIPRTIHQIWLGAGELPQEYLAFRQGWKELNPDFEFRIWVDEDVERQYGNRVDFSAARNLAEAADLLRYLVIRDHGGVYVDCDIEPLRPIAPYLAEVELFAGLEIPGRLCNAIFGATQGHPAMAIAAEYATSLLGEGVYPFNTATQMFTMVLSQFGDAKIFPDFAFYPYLWTEPERSAEEFPESIAVHHWAKTWEGFT